MTMINKIVFNLILFSFVCSHTFAQQDYGTAFVGQPCERDYHCINHAFCRAQLTCLCEPNYLPVPDLSMCVPSVGLICNNNAACALMSNAECRQNICACRETFTVDITNSSNCVARPVQENDPCQRNDECVDSLDRALCINNRCQCLTNHHFSPTISRCTRSSGMLEVCSHDYQCYMPDLTNSTEVLQCRDGICQCREGVSARPCNGAFDNSATTMTAILLLLTTIFLT